MKWLPNLTTEEKDSTFTSLEDREAPGALNIVIHFGLPTPMSDGSAPACDVDGSIDPLASLVEASTGTCFGETYMLADAVATMLFADPYMDADSAVITVWVGQNFGEFTIATRDNGQRF